MKNLKKLLIVSTVALSLFGFNTQSKAATNHVVQSGETYWILANKFGVSANSIKSANDATSNMLIPGQSLTIPNSTISAADKDLMARLVSAEAKGEPYAGKVAVATVILNRLDNKDFPDTIKDVIYQKDNGYYAFTPVQNGAINESADAESKKAVTEAIASRGYGQGSLFFYNPKTSTSDWIFSRQVTIKIGNHTFAK
ncbi:MULTISPECIES: cell wall hydrolase [Bacillaceae]|uniref:cell wall hydrolase n=1 Tax=Bacillaceae TaxID=186817 RepID=UPI001E3DCC16|nr:MULTISPECIES: cell wall hydrolase [Bacillaceae]MCE4047680.1 cell wall hydrolase [Bacillus sp. Au-Bac7]MCM3031127.1 cell wall hydrolase [Niallia sp. MER 6]MDL0434703.1 cell wall hydrolase [Niallia sp. SS-2023]UPO85981.1 cell wall hydrolase [Niallia sp. Man26]